MSSDEKAKAKSNKFHSGNIPLLQHGCYVNAGLLFCDRCLQKPDGYH